MQNKTVRLILCAAALLVLTYFTVGYSMEFGKMLEGFDSLKQDPGQTDNIMIDGSDFTLFFKLLVFGSNGLVDIVNGIIILVEIGVSAVAAVILALLVRFLVYRQITAVTAAEFKSANLIFCGIFIVSLIVSVIVSSCRGLLYILLLHLLPFGIMYLIVLLNIYRCSKPAPMPQNPNPMQ